MSEVFPEQRKAFLKKALNISQTLMKENRLYPQDHWFIEFFEQQIAEIDKQH